MELTLNAMGTSSAFLLVSISQSCQKFSSTGVFSQRGQVRSSERRSAKSQKEFLAGAGPKGLCPGCICAGTSVLSGRSCRGAEDMPGSGSDRLQLDEMSKIHHFSSAQAPGISG